MYPGAPGYPGYPGQPIPYQPGPPPPGWVPPQGQAMYQQSYPPQPYGGMGMGPLPPHLGAFMAHYDADQTWDGSPSDVPKELGLLDQRRNDIYPQGKDNCAQFLRECQMKGLSFKIKAKKTRPYWTCTSNWPVVSVVVSASAPICMPSPLATMLTRPGMAVHLMSPRSWACSTRGGTTFILRARTTALSS